MKPTSNFVNPLLTDNYQLTMAYAYWKNGRQDDEAVFDLFFRKNPFKGEFTIFAGLEEVLRYVENFKFTDSDIRYLRDGMIVPKEELQKRFAEGLNGGWIRKRNGGGFEIINYGEWDFEYWEKIDYPEADQLIESPLKDCEPRFFEWLKSVDCSKIRIYAVPEGTIVFPKIPLLRVEGPLAVAQLLETTLLNLINFPSLMTTNAARFRLAVGLDKILMEFGVRRAQGADGAMSASRYSYIGGFNATSNVLAGKLFGVPVKGTMAHAFIQSFRSLKDLKNQEIRGPNGMALEFIGLVLDVRRELGFNNTNEGELAAFIAYAIAFPKSFLALVDTYDTLKSGVPNFLCVAVALSRIGYKPIGIRLDSGDLSYLSKKAKEMFEWAAGMTWQENIKDCVIVASNDINEEVLLALKQQGHAIDVFGIGTHLVTCQSQPALGCVYKLVEIKGEPRIKISQEVAKVTIPGRKEVYRLYLHGEAFPSVDLMIQAGEPPPRSQERILCRHPFNEAKRVYVKPTMVVPLHKLVWDGKRLYPNFSLEALRKRVSEQIKNMREDHLRFVNPTEYKVSVSEGLYQFIHKLWMDEAPVAEL